MRWYAVMAASMWAMFAVFLGGAFVPWSPLVGLLVAAPMLWFSVRSARISLTLSADGAVVRGMYRTRRVAWDDVEDVVGAGSSTGLRWRIPVIVLKHGAVRVDDLRSLREPSIVDEAVAAAQRYLDERP